jgi:hypothetical protein
VERCPRHFSDRWRRCDALPLFLSLRAAIRAKVEAAGSERLEGKKRDEARALTRRYFDSAVRFLAYVPSRLVAVGGLSGVGKSALAGAPPLRRLRKPKIAYYLRRKPFRRLGPNNAVCPRGL